MPERLSATFTATRRTTNHVAKMLTTSRASNPSPSLRLHRGFDLLYHHGRCLCLVVPETTLVLVRGYLVNRVVEITSAISRACDLGFPGHSTFDFRLAAWKCRE